MNVTYLLGAGASCEDSLPVNKLLVNSIRNFSTRCGNSANPGVDRDFFLSFFKRVLDAADKERSIDTLARVTTDQEVLLDIKKILWIYFSASTRSIPKDKRYKHLLSKYRIDRSDSFNLDPRLKFLSWNYDLQLEEALAELHNTEIRFVGKRFLALPNYKFIDYNYTQNITSEMDFRLIHLNGVAGFFYNHPSNEYGHWVDFNPDITEQANSIISMFKEINMNGSYRKVINGTITFAWEDTTKNDIKIETAKKIISNTSDLILVGYSIPPDNIDIDREILQNLPNGSKIYVQVGSESFQDVKEKLDEIFKNANDISTPEIRNCCHSLSDFYIPPRVLFRP